MQTVRTFLAVLMALFTFLAAVPIVAEAQTPGNLDTSFNPVIFGEKRNKQILVSPQGILVCQGGDGRSYVRLNDAGQVDSTFVALSTHQPILVQPDGKIIARNYVPFGSSFSVVRTDQNGNVELTFTGANESFADPDTIPLCGLYLPDGGVVVGNGWRLVWLSAAGTAYRTFGLDTVFGNPEGRQIRSLARQSDGKLILAAEGQELFAPDKSYYVIRLNENGTRDMSFGINGRVTANNSVEDIVCLPDDRIIMGGQFDNIAPFIARTGLARLTPNGTVEAAFNPHLSWTPTKLFDGYQLDGDEKPRDYNPWPYVLRMALQTDGKLVIFGSFDKVHFTNRLCLARITSDGFNDPSFNGFVDFAAGARYLKGHTEYYNYTDQVKKIWPDGAEWRWFDAGLALQADGKVLIGGEFETVNFDPRRVLARLHNDNDTDGSRSALVATPHTVSWNRSGTAPELLGVRFELSTNGGASWVPLGNGNRVGTSANWQISTQSLPLSGKIRARGLTHRGGLIGEEADLNFPVPVIQSFTPASGGVPTVVVITGTGFDFTSAVKFNGTTASFTLNSPTQITATVPLWATTGPVTVAATAGTATSPSNFTVVYPAPTITSFTPTNGAVGTRVTITGTGLDTTTAVRFNGTNAIFEISSPVLVDAYVPLGATTGPISVTTLGGTVTSSLNFTVNSGSLGAWSTTAWTGDATSGVPPFNSDGDAYFIAALHFGSSTNATVYGRQVEALGGSGSSSYIRPSPSSWNVYPNASNYLTAQGGNGSALMAASFGYDNDPQDVTVTNLTPGEGYRVSFLSVGWEAPGTRLVNFVSGTDHLVVDQDQFGQGNGIRVDYRFTAASSTQTISLDALNGGATWHNHAIVLARMGSLLPPTVTTFAATSITPTSAVLNGSVNANGGPTSVRFYYGVSNWNEYSIDAPQATGWGDIPVNKTVTGLLPHTTYQFTLSGTNTAAFRLGTPSLYFTTANTAPVAVNSSVTLPEDASIMFPLSVSDADGDDLTATTPVGPAHGTVVFYSFGQPYVLYTPSANYTGPDSFQYRVTDGFGGTSDTRLVNITVTAVNDQPTINGIPDSAINEDAGNQTVSLAGIGTGAANETQTLTVTAISNNPSLIPNPTVTYTSPNTTGSLTFTPVANANGTAVITVTVAESGGAGSSTKFWVTVNPVNDVPGFTLAGGTPAGVTWTARDSNRNWRSIASSADGTKLAAVVSNSGQIYTSTDSGVTWTARASGNRNWWSIASSSDGTKLAAVEYNGQIYTSTDSGATWTAREGSRQWYSIASSADGTKLAAVVENGQIYTSTDSGVTWTARLFSANWESIASSADGTKLAALGYNGQIYTSTNSGVTWTARESDRGWASIASSSDGTKLAAGVYGGQIYTSTDFGVTWTAQASGNRSWLSIASSADGTKLAAVSYEGQIYTSTNSGATWAAQASGSRRWNSIASSSDGTKLAAVEFVGQIYTSAPAPYGLSADSDSGANTIANFAANISAGPVNEAAQTVSFNLSNDNNALFSVQPAIASNGTLTFIPSGTATGTATVTVTVQDNGGVAFGGVDTSTSQTFTITINLGVNDAPSFTLPPSGNPAGVVWTARESSRYWRTIVSSSDGTKLAAIEDGGRIYTSTDSGATWTARESNRSWRAIASSADGTKLAAAVGNGPIYTSTNSGLTWTAQPGGNEAWESIVSSSDGTKLVVYDSSGQMFTSTDSGVTWTARESIRQWSSIASSADGTKLAATVWSGQIYTSTNSGVTWTARESTRQWSSIASSADGTQLAAGVNGGQIYTSTDSGATWTARASSSRDWFSIASSDDGTRLAAGVMGGQIHTSTDSGVTWTGQASGNRYWFSIASSSDGTKLAAAPQNGQIYTSVPVPYGLSVAANSGTNTVPALATNISPGPANEAAQTVNFNQSNTNNALFTVEPAIASNGTLTFTPNPSATGTATITVTAQDNGGVAFGGVDTSAPQTFTITVTASAPTVTTPAVTNITVTGATLGGDVAGSGGSPITERGVVFALTSANANPAINGAGVTKLTASGTTGVFTVNAAGLNQISGYSFKAYATNALGTSYTSVATFTTSDIAPPDTVITSAAPAGNSPSATITFTGSDNAGVTGFEGKLDGGSYATVTSPVTLTGLTQGTHTWSLRAKDAAGNADPTPASVTWMVDTVVPTFSLPGPVTAEATGAGGAAVTYAASANDVGGSGVATSSFLPVSGGTFPLGTTTVSATATDNAGNTNSASFTVTVRDTTAPQITAGPADRSLIGTPTASLPNLTGEITATDAVGVTSITQSPVAGTALAIGAHTITLTVRDAAGNTATDTVVITVAANQAPAFTGCIVTAVQNTPVLTSLAHFLTHASDADGGTLTVSSVSAASVQGGTLAASAAGVTYTPPAGYTGLDTFIVTISDGQGGTVDGTVTVNVTDGSPPDGNPKMTPLQNGTVALLFFGIPGQDYIINRSSNLGSWTSLQTVTAAGDGSLPFIDSSPPATRAFYQAVVP